MQTVEELSSLSQVKLAEYIKEKITYGFRIVQVIRTSPLNTYRSSDYREYHAAEYIVILEHD